MAHSIAPRRIRGLLVSAVRQLARLGRDRRGNTAVEFAFVLVPFLGLFLSIMQVGLQFFASESLQSAVEDAARNLYTGQAQTAGISSAATFSSTYLCPASGPSKLPSYMDCSKLIIDVRSASGFTAADMSADFYKSTTTFCPGAPGDIVVVRVIYPLPAIIPVLTGSGQVKVGVLRTGQVNDVPNNSGWKQLVLGTAVFQNEPYDGTHYVAPSGC